MVGLGISEPSTVFFNSPGWHNMADPSGAVQRPRFSRWNGKIRCLPGRPVEGRTVFQPPFQSHLGDKVLAGKMMGEKLPRSSGRSSTQLFERLQVGIRAYLVFGKFCLLHHLHHHHHLLPLLLHPLESELNDTNRWKWLNHMILSPRPCTMKKYDILSDSRFPGSNLFPRFEESFPECPP